MPFDVPVICCGTLPVISWVIGAEVDPSVFASPRYCAVITWTPTGKFVVRKETTPAFTRDGFPYVVPLSNNCTFPVGVRLPCGTTSTLNVTGVPNPTLRADELSVVVVAAGPVLEPPPPHPNTRLTIPATNPPNSKTFRGPLPRLAPIPAIPSSRTAAAEPRPQFARRVLTSVAVFRAAAGDVDRVRFSCVVACPPETGTLAWPKEHV